MNKLHFLKGLPAPFAAAHAAQCNLSHQIYAITVCLRVARIWVRVSVSNTDAYVCMSQPVNGGHLISKLLTEASRKLAPSDIACIVALGPYFASRSADPRMSVDKRWQVLYADTSYASIDRHSESILEATKLDTTLLSIADTLRYTYLLYLSCKVTYCVCNPGMANRANLYSNASAQARLSQI